MAVGDPRSVVVDAGRVIAGATRGGRSRRLILDPHLLLLAPAFLREELLEHQTEVAAKAGVPTEEMGMLLTGLLDHIVLLPEETYRPFAREATDVMAGIDPDDVPYVAVAIGFPSEGVWTEDRHCHRHERVEVMWTRTLLERLRAKKDGGV